jgi:DNA-binding transcriptional LysR family regulator
MRSVLLPFSAKVGGGVWSVCVTLPWRAWKAPQMEHKWLEDFISLASTSSFSRSAETRNVSQSAFSRRIRQLERWVGVALVDRSAYPARLTAAGRYFLPAAEEAVRVVQQARMDLCDYGAPHARTLTFTALHTLSLTFFPKWLREATRSFGPLQTKLEADRGGMEDNVAALVDGNSDFLLTYSHVSVPFLLDQSRFAFILLGTERVIPVTGRTAEGAPLHPIESDQMPVHYLAYGQGSFFFHGLADLFSRQPLQRRVVHENPMSAGLLSMALAGWGLAWVPESLAAKELASGRLVRAGGPGWDLVVEIRLYRALSNRRPIVERFWRRLQSRDKLEFDLATVAWAAAN